jgi:glycosyltransferase
MKVSIITISYNSALTIKETLNSVKNQSYKDIEHIIIDGKSSDSTLEICSNYPHLTKIISEKDSGVYDAFNKGLKNASGNIIGFLNSDDVFYDNNSLEKIVKVFDKNTDAVYGNLKFYDENKKIVRRWISKSFEKGMFKIGWMPPHPTFYCRKKVYDKYGNFNDSFKIAGDFELMLRFIECFGINTKFLNQNLIKMKSGGISNSGLNSKIKILKEEFQAFRINKISINKFKYIFYKALKIKEFL